MLKEAVRQASLGNYVIIYCTTGQEMVELTKRIACGIPGVKPLGEPRLGAKFEIDGGSLTFEHVSEMFDWRNLRERGVHPDCVTFMDHYSIERAWPGMVDMLYRFI